MIWRLFVLQLIGLCLASGCTGTGRRGLTQNEPVRPDLVQGHSKAKSAPKTVVSPRISWFDPETKIEYVYLGTGSFDTWAADCKKLEPEMKPLTMDLNFSKEIATDLLGSKLGAVFNSEEVKGSEIIAGRVIVYKLADLQDSPCESYPSGPNGGKLPAFFVPESALKDGLSENELWSLSYACKRSTRDHFPVPMVCAGK